MSGLPSRGEVWRADLEPVRGHEQGRSCSVLIVSTDIVNHGPAELATVVPITTRHRNLRAYLRIDPPEGGLKQVSFIICDQVRTIARERLERRIGLVSAQSLQDVEERLRFLLEL